MHLKNHNIKYTNLNKLGGINMDKLKNNIDCF